MRQRIELHLPGGGDRDETAPEHSPHGWNPSTERWYRLFDAEMKARGSRYNDDYKAAQFYAAYQKWDSYNPPTMKIIRHAAKLCAKGVDIAARGEFEWRDWAIENENEDSFTLEPAVLTLIIMLGVVAWALFNLFGIRL